MGREQDLVSGLQADDATDKNYPGHAAQMESTEFASKLTGSRRDSSELIVNQQRQEHFALLTMGYLQAIGRVSALGKRAEKEHASESYNLIQRLTGTGLIDNEQSDALETVRKQLGLDELRERLLNELRDKVNVEEGFKRLRALFPKKNSLSKADEETLLAAFPRLTVAEISLLPLLERVPVLFCSGAPLKSPDHAMKKDRSRRIPQFLYARTTGMAVGTDDLPLDLENVSILELDVFQGLGLTGRRNGEEEVDFEPAVARAIKALVPLCLSNSQLYETVLTEASDAAQRAFGMIQHYALQMVLGETDLNLLSIDLGTAIQSLPKEQHKQYLEIVNKIESNLAIGAIFDLSKKRLLDTRERFVLLGILSEVPAVICDAPPSCYVLPFGTSIRFLDETGRVLDQVPMSPMYSRNAVHELHYSAENGRRENEMAHQIYVILRREMSSQVLERFQRELPLSAAEELAMEFWLKRGTAIEVSGDYNLVRNVNYNQVLSGREQRIVATKKIGFDEAQLITRTLDSLPPSMLAKVLKVRKIWNEPKTLRDRMNGTFTQGQYEFNSRCISLMEYYHTLFPDSSVTQRIMLAFTLLHECGEAVWTTLKPTQTKRWTKISWRKKKRKLNEHFLTRYAHTENSKEDFCEHFAAFVVHGSEFMERKSPPLRQKYQFLAELFAEHAGKELNYPGVTYRIEDIHQELDLANRRRTAKEAMEEAEAEAQLRNEKAVEDWSDQRHDIDEFLDELDQDPEEELHHEDVPDDDWYEITKFLRGKDLDSMDQSDSPTPKARLEVQKIREEVVDILRELLPERSGQLLPLAIEVSTALLLGDKKELKDLLSFVNPSQRKKEAYSNLVALVQNRP
jgi:hypothetical protein